MKKLLIITLVTLFSITSYATAQEDPEPTEPVITADPNQDFQIRWGQGVWETLVPTSVTFANEEPPPEHIYFAQLGTQTIRALAQASDTSPTPNVCTFTFDVGAIPSGNWWGFYSVRYRVRRSLGETYETISPWSESSYWVAIISLGQPGRPVH